MKTNVCGIMRDLEAEAIAYKRRSDAIRLAAQALRRDEISHICAQHELESDEFFTAEQKAIRIINANKRS
jgi:hypothetical protein